MSWEGEDWRVVQERRSLRVWWALVLACLAVIVASVALVAQECPPSSDTGRATGWAVVGPSEADTTWHTNLVTAVREAQRRAAASRGDTLRIVGRYRVVCGPAAAVDTVEVVRADTVEVVRVEVDTVTVVDTVFVETEPPAPPPDSVPASPLGIYGSVVGIDWLFELDGAAFRADTAGGRNPRLVVLTVGSADPGVTPPDVPIFVDGGPAPDTLAVFALSDGEHVATADGVPPARFTVQGIGDTGPPSMPGKPVAEVDSLRLVVDAAGDTVTMAEVRLSATPGAGALAYRWTWGREGTSETAEDETREPVREASQTEGTYWVCIRAVNTIAASEHNCTTYAVPSMGGG